MIAVGNMVNSKMQNDFDVQLRNSTESPNAYICDDQLHARNQLPTPQVADCMALHVTPNWNVLGSSPVVFDQHKLPDMH